MGTAPASPSTASARAGAASFGPAEDRRRYLHVIANEQSKLRRACDDLYRQVQAVCNQQLHAATLLMAGDVDRAREAAVSLTDAREALNPVIKALATASNNALVADLFDLAEHITPGYVADIDSVIRERLEEFSHATTETIAQGAKQ